MDLLKGPIREGSRGGRGEFRWEDVKDSKDREYYLGVSVKAPSGRWQQGRDLNWYSKGNNQSPEAIEARKARAEEFRKIKEAENDALSEALGFKVVRRQADPGLSQSEVDRAIREVGDNPDDGGEMSLGKGIGYGRTGLVNGFIVKNDDETIADSPSTAQIADKHTFAKRSESLYRNEKNGSGDRRSSERRQDRRPEESPRSRSRSRSRHKHRERHRRQRSRDRHQTGHKDNSGRYRERHRSSRSRSPPNRKHHIRGREINASKKFGEK